MNKKFVFAMSLIMISSIFVDILMVELWGSIPSWWPYTKLCILSFVSLLCVFVKKLKPFFSYALILTVFILVHILTKFIIVTEVWIYYFEGDTFVSQIGSEILLKLIMVIPIIVVLLVLLKSRKAAYLTIGDLSVKADKIGWLGIEGKKISWGKLSVISAFLISFGTLLLTLITVTGFSMPVGAEKLIFIIPIIIIFAFVNSFCEGVLFRSTILGTLRDVLSKHEVIMIAAIFFGFAHYYGAPSGVIGVVMSGLLGWYMCRSMYETKGFASAWIIHFMQDVVIFTSLYLLVFL